MEESKLNLSLLFYPSRITKDVVYSIDIINDDLLIKTNRRAGNKEYRGKITDTQSTEIKQKVSALTEKYDRSELFAFGAWGCILKVDNQVYYIDNYFRFTPRREIKGMQPLPSTPEEIKQLIDYIVGLSPIPIILFSFS